MRRRESITLIGSAAAAGPLAARAQQSAMPLVGFLNAQTAAGYTHLVAAFKQGLNENGFVEGQNVTIEYRWADRHLDQLPELAAELVRLRPDVLVGTGGAHIAAIAATKTIPIVVSFGGDPVKLGYVASLNKPGGNVTGVTVFSPDLETKRLELINEIVPRGATIGYFMIRISILLTWDGTMWRPLHELSGERFGCWKQAKMPISRKRSPHLRKRMLEVLSWLPIRYSTTSAIICSL
jgi:putative ABC transport system substrate-binding protein